MVSKTRIAQEQQSPPEVPRNHPPYEPLSRHEHTLAAAPPRHPPRRTIQVGRTYFYLKTLLAQRRAIREHEDLLNSQMIEQTLQQARGHLKVIGKIIIIFVSKRNKQF